LPDLTLPITLDAILFVLLSNSYFTSSYNARHNRLAKDA